MKKILFCIIISILLVNSCLAAGVLLTKGDNSTTTPQVLEIPSINEIPEIGRAVMTVNRFEKVTECTLTGWDDIEVNWTGHNQTVTFYYEVNSVQDEEMRDLIIHIRIREWSDTFPVATFFGISEYGAIETPGFKRNIPIHIPLHAGVYNDTVNISLWVDTDEPFINGAGFFWYSDFRVGGIFNFEWATIKMYMTPG